MAYEGTDNTLAMADHADHIHVGFHPDATGDRRLGSPLATALAPEQWSTLIDRLQAIDNPRVLLSPGLRAIKPIKRGASG